MMAILSTMQREREIYLVALGRLSDELSVLISALEGGSDRTPLQAPSNKRLL